MTSAQTQIVNSTMLRLTIEWVRAQDVITGRCQTRGAMADLTHDCYIGRTRVAFSARDGEVCFGWLTWRLDATFTALGPPETRLRAWQRR